MSTRRIDRRDGVRRDGAFASISVSTRKPATCGWARSARPWEAGAVIWPAGKMLMQYLKYTTPAFVFATAISPANAAAALEALSVLRQEPARVAQLRQRSQMFLKLAGDCGLNTGDSRDTPIIPVILGDSPQCIRVVGGCSQKASTCSPSSTPLCRKTSRGSASSSRPSIPKNRSAAPSQVLTECIAASGPAGREGKRCVTFGVR